MKLLAIDSISEHPGAVLFENGEPTRRSILTSARSIFDRRAEDEIFPRIVALGEIHDVDQIAITHGPGSFTGIRVGLSIAAGLAFDRRVPVHGIDTLDALERIAPDAVPVVQLRKSDWFIRINDETVLVDEPTLITRLNGKLAAALGSLPDEIARLPLENGLAESIGRLALENRGVPAQPNYIAETYVR